jgi:hypothetical protein
MLGNVSRGVTSSTAALRSDDLASVLALSAWERAATAIAAAITELAETGVATERDCAVLLKHFLVHLTGLQQEFEQFMGPADLDVDLLRRAHGSP